MSSRRFRLNRRDKKIMGVCAGIADHLDMDVTLVRVAAVLALIMTFPIAGIAYLLVGMIAKPGDRFVDGGYDAPRLSEASADATRQRMRDLDARMAAIETHVTSSNTSLAREIDALR